MKPWTHTQLFDRFIIELKMWWALSALPPPQIGLIMNKFNFWGKGEGGEVEKKKEKINMKVFLNFRSICSQTAEKITFKVTDQPTD
jgi:hypothetical protein